MAGWQGETKVVVMALVMAIKAALLTFAPCACGVCLQYSTWHMWLTVCKCYPLKLLCMPTLFIKQQQVYKFKNGHKQRYGCPREAETAQVDNVAAVSAAVTADLPSKTCTYCSDDDIKSMIQKLVNNPQFAYFPQTKDYPGGQQFAVLILISQQDYAKGNTIIELHPAPTQRSINNHYISCAVWASC